jgi:hypothetical protein
VDDLRNLDRERWRVDDHARPQLAWALRYIEEAPVALSARGGYTDGVIKIGVMSDMSGLYADNGGPGCHRRDEYS